MIILDTHAWIWWTSEPRKLGRKAQYRVRKADRIGISAITCWEFAMLVERGRIEIDRPPLEWIEQAFAQPKAELVPLTPAIAVTSTQLGAFHGDPADRIIVATAVVHGSKLISRDEEIAACPLVETVW
ncbi:MAG: type II toxin-antitoxin system VapC family toxin [Myxococcota bacterium]